MISANTYFETSKRGSALAKYGRSKEKRSDCPLVVFTGVINAQGFIRHSRIYEGNKADSTTLPEMLDDLQNHAGQSRKQTLVMDAGITSEENLKLIKERGHDYVCVSRHRLKDYPYDSEKQQVTVLTDRDKSSNTLQCFHYVTDNEGLVLGVTTTKASTNEIANLEEVLLAADLPEDIPLKADKGYQSAKNAELLTKRRLKNHILKKAKKNKTLTRWELRFNKLIGKTRFKVERTFGGIKRWFNGGTARYRGIEKMHTQNLIEAVCYNLYRSPGIIVSNAV